jgi:hypothetical protein
MEDFTSTQETILSHAEEIVDNLEVTAIVGAKLAENCTTETCDVPIVIETVVESRIFDEPTENIQRPKGVQGINLFQSAIQSWVDGWIAEDNSLVMEAKQKFQQAYELSTEALRLDLENLEYQTFVNISSLKIEGNRAFNEAVKLQEQANATSMKYLFQEARNKFQEASGKYHQAYLLTKNKNFSDCCKFIDESVSLINMAIRRIQLNTGVKDSDKYFRM